MSKEELIGAILNATPAQLAAVTVALAGDSKPAPGSLRLVRMGEAATETGLSRCTLWRAIQEGRLRAVEVRKGSRRIPEAELRRFVGQS